MAKVTIQHGCGHDVVIDSPGPIDPQGLLKHLDGGRRAAPHSKCAECDPSQHPGLPSAADLDAVAKEKATAAKTAKRGKKVKPQPTPEENVTALQESGAANAFDEHTVA